MRSPQLAPCACHLIGALLSSAAALGTASYKEYRLHAGPCGLLCVSSAGSWVASAGLYDATVAIWQVLDPPQPGPGARAQGQGGIEMI